MMRAVQASRPVFPAMIAAILLGCMAEPDAPDSPGFTEDPLPADDRHAGASSSTNWPVEACGRNVQVLQSADTALTLRFLRRDSAVTLGGKATFFQGGVIPVLEAVPAWTMEFPETDTLRIPLDRLRDSLGANLDTLSFSIRLEVGDSQALLYGYIHSRSQGRFLRDPSGLSEKPVFLKKPGYYYQGTTDSLLASLPRIEGNSEASFYIPGTPYFWRRSLDSLLELGPLPEGAYPLRMLRLTDVGNKGREFLVEIFEIQFQVSKEVTDRGVLHFQFFKATGQVWSGRRASSPPLRDAVPSVSPGGTSCTSS